ncbi:MAG: 4-hydroxy-tetrahydrodipicolinate reductase [Candidatus Gracilibacteria bacterium]|nr:4-hydroxy-tetrahydrodipicolinate reductase [Candidatus Gracilibacteria bacterium]
MNIALVGHGKMGQLVEIYAQKRGHVVVAIIDPNTSINLDTLLDKNIDVVIEFSVPSVTLDHMIFYAEHNMRVIMATTGWYDQMDMVKSLFADSQGALLWSSNFSLGVHIFWRMIENASKIMNQFDDYDVFGHEFHHSAKVDSPSGTALTTSQILLDNIDRKTTLVTETLSHRKILPEELHFSSTRGGSMPGTHAVYFDSLFDTITIEHQARNREGFALGSVVCAEWLRGKRGYFEIQDFIKGIM